MRTFLIGHRGVGKSTVLRTLAQRGLKTLDLDAELERVHGADVFTRVGEAEFRALESEALNTVHESDEGDETEWVALGAGFSDWAHPAFLRTGAKKNRVIWLTRASDRSGRIFLNRPRLEPKLRPLDEFLKRRDAREAAFLRMADDIIELPAFCAGELHLPERLFNPHVELEAQIALGRRGERVGPPEWPIEKGVPEGSFKILSSHRPHSQDDLERAGRDFPEAILKYAPPVETWAELRAGHEWASRDPRRAFLPCSSSGRWAWYRLLTGPSAPMTFLRDGVGTAPDQPSIDAWLLRRKLKSKNFAAVLGEGVELSASPDFHAAYFEARSMPYFAIEVRRGEWQEALPFLTVLGLRFASVTSPLKLDAAKEVGAAKPVNTLWFKKDRWHGCDTDGAGWNTVKRLSLESPVVLWGGQAIAQFENDFVSYSARTGKPRNSVTPEVEILGTLIWGVPRSAVRSDEIKNPPLHWKPTLVIDLNYAEDSPGREFALERGIAYRDGVEFFKAQAYEQQNVWTEEMSPV